ncbi:MAG TPA: alpha/beta fold hydrolase [Gammaproteobacteria bacterium]|nr:alpha/beta fold hydrolase [Gammaproteobacteria bacterium]
MSISSIKKVTEQRSLTVTHGMGLPDRDIAQATMTTDHIIDVDGYRLRVREQGRPRSPAVVLVHGFAHSLESWDAWASDLARDHRVVAFDLPGHGLSGPDAEKRYSNKDTVDALAALIRTLGLRRPFLVGNSLGGLVAWRYAARAAARLRGLILIAPGGYSINGVTDAPAGVPLMMSAFLRMAPEAAVRAMTRKLYGDPERVAEARVEMIHARMSGEGVGDALVRRLKQFTLPDPDVELARINAPTLLLWGGKDTVVPPEHAERFAAAMKRASLKIYNDLGHVPHEEAPERTLADARAFLRKHRR